jgi:hypothetical protein
MLNRAQALAAMDAHIIRVEAERRHHLQRRTRWITRLYPSLRRVPLDARQDLAMEATVRALRSWPVYTMVVLVIAVIILPFHLPDREVSGVAAFVVAAVTLIAMGTPAIAFYLRVRSDVERAVADRYH